jgi:hypothetical protein
MIDEAILDHNMFSLKLAQNETDEGALCLEATTTGFSLEALIPHPWYQPETKMWNVEASSLSMTTAGSSGNPQVHVNVSLNGYRALLSTIFHPVAFTEPLR